MVRSPGESFDLDRWERNGYCWGFGPFDGMVLRLDGMPLYFRLNFNLRPRCRVNTDIRFWREMADRFVLTTEVVTISSEDDTIEAGGLPAVNGIPIVDVFRLVGV